MIVRILLLFIALFTFGAQAQAIKKLCLCRTGRTPVRI